MSEKEYDYYVAGPFFDPEQTSSMERLEKVLEEHGKKLFKPRFVSQFEEVGPEGCFADDIKGINSSKAVIANLMDEDAGTMFEIGYAHALGMPVYGYFDGLTPMDRVNLMVAQAVEMVFAGPEDVAKYLETGEHTEVDYIQF
ncbi:MULTISPECIES: nucleoside 2-deoxyribosyltransferase [Bifidobacterium]|uniref:Nucleoside 2-deoxyribosyltransferase n=1 Tax=Bifidobacterium reuteri DSM 23975 TaxID=1437610 RepID=A0A087CMM3_9BIFI|nr:MULTISPECIES: nucleoside 2-deoxyribosyltransferase [Bifidobacterium]KFI84523.1 Nucleoside 2-deoxyribosyltransferase [Bifidobacterium reuteri DSM 23975]TPF78771.1 nucleoside 2-deoxyribosyltransferase [Bifidobacterium sp. UTCIF-1]TPF80735.1 nucleoside 2-deoxyribosyltransferase [Bifidobacterium sp. UTCIF-24]TPF82640.1 nucleoside 2-deoxyribosyltransferase [Bifidobacterium sp. UTCIF-3]TPF84781.1 nucleoside 2-deoxyribosyltransferase [Bifidobacterium sp. UTCIF-36]